MAKKTAVKKTVQQAVEQPPATEQAVTSQDTSIVDINSEVIDEETELNGTVGTTAEESTVEESGANSPFDETDEEGGPTLITTGFIKCDGIRYQPGERFPIDHPEAERLFELGVVKEG
jgi:hypothetical protein